MTVTELRKRAEELEAEGFGDVQVTLIDEFARRKNRQPRAYGIYAPYEFKSDSWLGGTFDNTRRDMVFLDVEDWMS